MIGLSVGCAHLQPLRHVPAPFDTISAYRTALQQDNPAIAYQLLAPAARQHVSYDQFNAQWQETRPERDAQLGLLSLPTRPESLAGPSPATHANERELLARITTQAAVALPEGTVLTLTPGDKPGRAWQVVDPDLAAVSAESPETVLRLLADAVEERNYFALLRLLSTAERQAIEAELRERLDRLRMSLSRQKPLPIEVEGDKAHYQYDPRFFIDLVRQKDGWRVLDLN
jgi:hypothetical protein